MSPQATEGKCPLDNYMDMEFYDEAGEATATFGIPKEARSVFDKIEVLKEFYIDWYIDRLALNSRGLQADTPFDSFEFINFTVHLSETASPFHFI